MLSGMVIGSPSFRNPYKYGGLIGANMSSEIWKYINGYEGMYQVSNFGRVRSMLGSKKIPPRILRQHKNRYGYPCVTLCVNMNRKLLTVHRLVSIHFIPNYKNKPQVNHINLIKTDNRAENLEWVTRSENITHLNNNGGKKSKRLRIMQFDKSMNLISVHKSMTAASLDTSIAISAICSNCKGAVDYAGGFIFKYEN